MPRTRNNVRKATVEDRLARHAQEKGFCRVVQAGFDSPFAILLQGAKSDGVIGRYFEAYMDYVKSGNLSQVLIEDAMLDENPTVPSDWQELSRRYLARDAESEEEARTMGNIVIIDGGRGDYTSSSQLLRYLDSRNIPVSDFTDFFGFDPSKMGVATVNAHTPNRGQRIISQVHETIHGRDAANGLTHEEYIENLTAVEVLTDLRAFLHTKPVQDDEFIRYRTEFQDYLRRMGYSPATIVVDESNMEALESLRSAVQGSESPEIATLAAIREGIRGDEKIRRLVFETPAFKEMRDASTTDEQEKVELVIDRLIELEGKSKLPPAVPHGFRFES